MAIFTHHQPFFWERLFACIENNAIMSIDLTAARQELWKIYKDHQRTLERGIPQLNVCDVAVMNWAPPGCKKINDCHDAPLPNPKICVWDHWLRNENLFLAFWELLVGFEASFPHTSCQSINFIGRSINDVTFGKGHPERTSQVRGRGYQPKGDWVKQPF